jgi:hypothetical protein
VRPLAEKIFQEDFENDDVTARAVGREDGTIDLLIQDFDGEFELVFDRETGLAFCAWLIIQMNRLPEPQREKGEPESPPPC